MSKKPLSDVCRCNNLFHEHKKGSKLCNFEEVTLTRGEIESVGEYLDAIAQCISQSKRMLRNAREPE